MATALPQIAQIDNSLCSKTSLRRMAAQTQTWLESQRTPNLHKIPFYVITNDMGWAIAAPELSRYFVLLYSNPPPVKEIDTVAGFLHARQMTRLTPILPPLLLRLAEWHTPPNRLVLLDHPIWIQAKG